MFEVIGLVLAVVGVVFAFETPRRRLVGLFKRAEAPIEHTFRVRTAFHGHNGGLPLGPLGTNKVEKAYVFSWTVRNRSAAAVQLEPGMVMRPRVEGRPQLTLGSMGQEQPVSLLPAHTWEVLDIELTAGEVDHYRHWVRECSAFGIRDTSRVVHWVPDSQFQQFAKALHAIAKELGLAAEVPHGVHVVLQVKRQALQPQAEPKPEEPQAEGAAKK